MCVYNVDVLSITFSDRAIHLSSLLVSTHFPYYYKYNTKMGWTRVRSDPCVCPCRGFSAPSALKRFNRDLLLVLLPKKGPATFLSTPPETINIQAVAAMQGMKRVGRTKNRRKTNELDLAEADLKRGNTVFHTGN